MKGGRRISRSELEQRQREALAILIRAIKRRKQQEYKELEKERA